MNLTTSNTQALPDVEVIKKADEDFAKFRARVTFHLDTDSGLITFCIDGAETQTWCLDDTSGAEEVFEDYLTILRTGWVYSRSTGVQS